MGCRPGGPSSVIYTGYTAHLKSWLPSPACYPDFLLSLVDDPLQDQLPGRPRLASQVLFFACQLTMTHISPHVLHLARCKLCCESCGCFLKTHRREETVCEHPAVPSACWGCTCSPASQSRSLCLETGLRSTPPAHARGSAKCFLH